MQLYRMLLINFIFISTIYSNDADNILLNVMNRLKGVDKTLFVELTQEQKGKPLKKQSFISWTHWDEIDKKKFVKILIKEPSDLAGVMYWSHLDSMKFEKKWMTMPITGKLKDITDIPPNKDDFDFTELEVSQDDIVNHTNSIISEEILNNREIIIIESKKNDTN